MHLMSAIIPNDAVTEQHGYCVLYTLTFLTILALLLGIKTTRALSVVGTGQNIKRPWYTANSKAMMESGGSKRSRFAPDTMVSEPGKRKE
jgi:hypothetical protein